mmetsp:Transcript_8453/g.20886  ORF Transcript_8453/g.20886 Transcript_8453/m.20886 type:complete len:558 (+) Transcript_8453:138-1811(+)
MTKARATRTIAAVAIHCCVLASSTSNAFVVPSSLSSHTLTSFKITPSRNLIISPPIQSFGTIEESQSKSYRGHLEAAPILSSSSSSASLSSDQKSVLSVGLWCALDIAFRRLFQSLDLATKFPSSLAGCGALLAVLLLSPKSSSSSTQTNESKLYRLLSPGAALLAKWLPVFFVPSLVTLPLVGGVDSLGGPTELLKTLAVVLGGFYFTLLTTAGSVLGVGKLMGKKDKVEEEDSSVATNSDDPTSDFTSAMPKPVAKPFSDDLMKKLRIAAIFSGLCALEGAAPVFNSPPARLLVKLQTPLLSLLLGSTTLAGFVYGSRMNPKVKKVVHPLVTCTALTWTVMKVFSNCVGRSFGSMLTSYKMGKGFNGLFGTGPGDILLFLLGPAVMSLAISMYDKRDLIRENFAQIATAVSVSSLGGLFGTAWMVRLIALMQPSFRVALLSRNITSPLAMAIAGLLGASASTVSLAVALVVVTGLFGANFGAASLNAAGIKNPVARGMGIGAAAHGLGTAAFVDEKDAFPFSAISMALTATACTCLVSVPAIKKIVLKIALSGVA